MHLLLPPIRYELLPEIERRFRGIGAGWARGTYGGSTGAWEALAVQVKYPTEYNGCIACAPDPIDFRALSPINIYNQTNAFRSGGGGVSHSLQLKEDQTGSARTYTGKMLATIEDDFRFEAALGGAVSGGQIGIWMAAYEAERRLSPNIYRASLASPTNGYSNTSLLTSRWCVHACCCIVLTECAHTHTHPV